MADEKPFEASAARVARAKRDGDLPRSQEVNAAASLACASLALLGAWPVLAAAARRAVLDAFAASSRPVPYVALAACVMATIGCALGGALLATYLQTRTFTLKFPTPKFEKLDLVRGFKRMLSRESLIGGAKALAVSSVVVAALGPVLRDSFVAGGGATTAANFAALVRRSLETIVASALGVAALAAALDLLLERGKWRARLRMNFDELKRDQRQSEGDPMLKGRRRQAHRSLVRGSIGRVADAAFVVANPTHVAIALEYRPPEVAVPRVIVRAVDAGALAVKGKARALRVPIVENVSLARALLATTGVGEFIAPDLYGAVASIVAALAGARALP
jgi:flagellar biosynthetic protein FlhB